MSYTHFVLGLQYENSEVIKRIVEVSHVDTRVSVEICGAKPKIMKGERAWKYLTASRKKHPRTMSV